MPPLLATKDQELGSHRQVAQWTGEEACLPVAALCRNAIVLPMQATIQGQS